MKTKKLKLQDFEAVSNQEMRNAKGGAMLKRASEEEPDERGGGRSGRGGRGGSDTTCYVNYFNHTRDATYVANPDTAVSTPPAINPASSWTPQCQACYDLANRKYQTSGQRYTAILASGWAHMFGAHD